MIEYTMNDVKNEVGSVFQTFYAVGVGDKSTLSVSLINYVFSIYLAQLIAMCLIRDNIQLGLLRKSEIFITKTFTKTPILEIEL